MDLSEFLEKFNLKLNDQQIEAVRATEGPVLLLAVPGSGKTTVLVSRLGYMICCLGIPPENILTMTYTVAAAKDMKNRFVTFFGEEYADRLQFRTINGVCARILLDFERVSGRKAFDLITDEKKTSELISEIYRKRDGGFPTDSDIKNVRALITYAKNMMLSREEIGKLNEKGLPFSGIFDDYNAYLRKNRLMDYDDQMIYALSILKKYPDILAFYRQRFPYLCVDEAQDTSKIQHTIIALLAGESDNLFMVGDEDQSIYGFRAAYPDALTDFGINHKNAKILLMETNYRSGSGIVDTADRFIRKNKFRHEKKMTSCTAADGSVIERKLTARRSQYYDLLNIASKAEQTTAVLYRNNESALPLIDLLERRGVPYRLRQFDPTFFTHRIVTDICNIIRFAYDNTNTDIFMQIYYKMSTYLQKSLAEEACEVSRRQNVPVLEAAMSLGLSSGTLKSCLGIRKNLDALKNDRGDAAVARITDYMGYGAYIERMGLSGDKAFILEAIGASESTANGLLRRLEELQTILLTKKYDPDSRFILSTIHSSKGLEYDSVYLIDVCDGIFPENVITDTLRASETELKDYMEERRLFYVGITRAKSGLTIFRYDDFPSYFADEIFRREKTGKPEFAGRAAQFSAGHPMKKRSDKEYEQFRMSCEKMKAVDHRFYHRGIITDVDGEFITVAFTDGVSRRMFLPVLFENGILRII